MFSGLRAAPPEPGTLSLNRRTPSVPAIVPGAMALTRMPRRPHSTAQVRVSESTPALAAATCDCMAAPLSSKGAEMFTTLPPCSPSQASKAALETLKVPSRSISTTALKPLGEIFVIGAGKLPAALFTTMSSRPYRSMMPSTTCRTADSVPHVASVDVHLDAFTGELGSGRVQDVAFAAGDRDPRAVSGRAPGRSPCRCRCRRR